MKQRGYILIVINALMAVLLVYGAALVRVVITAEQTERKEDLKLITKGVAEAGIAKAVWCFNQNSGENCGGTFGSSYAGETSVSFGSGVYDSVITSLGGTVKQIDVTAYYPSKTKILAKSIVRSRISTDTDRASFVYGLQSGQGGIELGGSATINGSVYAMGSVTGASGAKITGDVYVAGGTAFSANQSWTTYNTDFTFGKINSQTDIAQSFIPTNSDVLNKLSFYIKKIGSPANIIVRIVADNGGVPGTTELSSGILNSSLVGINYAWVDVAFPDPPPLYSGTKYWIILDAAQHASKYWNIGTDAFDGYTNGTMLYTGSWSAGPWTSTGKDIDFKVWLGGVATEINYVEIGGNAYAHKIIKSDITGNASAYTISDSEVGGNAWAYEILDDSDIAGNTTTTNISDSEVGGDLWCMTHTDTIVGGSVYCPTTSTPPADPGPVNEPVSEALINEWKNDAAAGGTINGDYSITTDVSLGPKKINGNLNIGGNLRLNITGTIYVTGDITINTNAILSLDPSYGSSSGVIIADGGILILNGALLSGSGEDGSYLMMLTTKNSAVENAVDINNNSNSAIFYAPYGIININNNAVLKESCGYKLIIGNSAVFNYEMGMAEIFFSSGPSGGWSELKGYWQVIE